MPPERSDIHPDGEVGTTIMGLLASDREHGYLDDLTRDVKGVARILAHGGGMDAFTATFVATLEGGGERVLRVHYVSDPGHFYQPPCDEWHFERGVDDRA